MRPTKRFLGTVSCVILAVAVTGCSKLPPVYEASGVVVYADGSPVQDGRIETRVANSQYTSRGAIDREGRFRLTTFKADDGAIAGTHQALVIQRFSADIDNMAEHSKHVAQLRRVAREYSRYETSGLEFTIDPKSENTNIRLVVKATAD